MSHSGMSPYIICLGRGALAAWLAPGWGLAEPERGSCSPAAGPLSVALRVGHASWEKLGPGLRPTFWAVPVGAG